MSHTLIPYAPDHIGGGIVNRSDSRHLRQLSLGLGQPEDHVQGVEQRPGNGRATWSYPKSASRSALASCKSAVSKPLVNQP